MADQKPGEVQTESGEMLKGAKPVKGSDEKKVLSQGAPGEDRTPDQPIGEIARMKRNDQGGAGQPQASNLEPEKQGGIGGP